MAESTPPEPEKNSAFYKGEIRRLNKIIQALMNRVERNLSVHGSAFGLFETTVQLGEEVRRRTEQLENALRENERINHALNSAQEQMREEIQRRQQFEGELRKANYRLERLSTTDPLTGLANRRRFMEALTAEWNRSLRNRNSIGMSMIDIDFFKTYNDRYGHLAGDHCLQQVAKALKTAVRNTDIPARYGGEEFAIIFPSTNFETVHQVADRARKAVSGIKMPHADNPLGILTVSVGVAAVIPSAKTAVTQLIAFADTALYEAKRDGRNRVRGHASAPSQTQTEKTVFNA